LQPLKFFVIIDQAVKTKLKAVSWDQAQVVDCSHHFVFTIRDKIDEPYVDHYIDRIAQVRGVGRAAQSPVPR